MLFLASTPIMVRRLAGSLTWERFALIGFLGVVGSIVSGLTGALLGTVVCLAPVATFGVETARHREGPVASDRDRRTTPRP